MTTHIVIFNWVATVSVAQVDDLRQALDRLGTELRHLVSIDHGPDLRLRDGNGDYALVATFRNAADWQTYQADPLHKAFVHDYVLPIQASRLTVQF